MFNWILLSLWFSSTVLTITVLAYYKHVIDNHNTHLEVLNRNLQSAFEAINMLTSNQEQIDDIVEAIRYEQTTKH